MIYHIYCPDCGAVMNLKQPGAGAYWTPFWGCSLYPACKGTRNINEDGNIEDRKVSTIDKTIYSIWFDREVAV